MAIAERSVVVTERSVVVVGAVCGRGRSGLQSWWRFTSSAVVVAWSRSWAMDFGSWVRVGETARGGEVPGSTENRPTRAISCVCVRVRACVRVAPSCK